MAAGRLEVGAKYFYRVWEGFVHQASSILRAFKNHPKSIGENNLSKCSDLGPYFINSRVYQQEVWVSHG
jgi:hypothetical protein